MSTLFTVALDALDACPAAIAWVGDRTFVEAWEECPRSDWLLWYAEVIGVDRRLLVLATCAIVRTALPYVPYAELRPEHAIENAEAWARGESISIAEVRVAARAAYACADIFSVDVYAATVHTARAAGAVGSSIYYLAPGSYAYAARAAAIAHAEGVCHAADVIASDVEVSHARLVRSIIPFEVVSP